MSGGWELLAFAGVLALGQFSPGPDMLLLTRVSLRDGARAGVATAWGIATGLTVHAALALGGMSVLFANDGWLGTAMRWVAACYLLWLGYGMVREWFVDRYSGSEREPPGEARRGSAYVTGLLCNLLNPKVVVFLGAVVAPFLAGEKPAWWPWALWAIVVFEGFILWALWALLLQARPVRRFYDRAAMKITLAFGLVMWALAAVLLFG